MSDISANDDLYGVYGSGGCGRGIMPLARAEFFRRFNKNEYSRLVFIDDSVDIGDERYSNGHRVISFAEFMAIRADNRFVNIAVADGSTRALLAEKCEASGVIPWSICASNAVIMDDVIVGEGASISPFVSITSNIRIGRSFHANLYSYVEHDCVIGNFVTFAPGAKCNGNVVIEDYAYLGSGCVIKQGLPSRPLVIGRGATVGMGAVVTRDVPAGATVVGSPARILIKTQSITD